MTTLLGVVFAVPTIRVHAAQQIFMNVEGVPGESIDSLHRNWINVSSFSHGVSHPRTGASTNSAPLVGQMYAMKTLDKSSPILAKYCANGTVIPSIKLEFVNGTNSQSRFYQIGLSNAIVTSLQHSGSSGTDTVTENLSFAYKRIDWTYTQFSGTGVPLGDIKTFWDLILNIGNLDIPIRVTKMTLESGGARLAWSSVAGKSYSIMSSPSVNGPYNFLKLVPSAGDGETSTVISNRLASEFFIIKTQ